MVWPRPQSSLISDVEANQLFADLRRAKLSKRLYESRVLVNGIGLSCQQVVNQKISQPSGAVPREVVRKISDRS